MHSSSEHLKVQKWLAHHCLFLSPPSRPPSFSVLFPSAPARPSLFPLRLRVRCSASRKSGAPDAPPAPSSFSMHTFRGLARSGICGASRTPAIDQLPRRVAWIGEVSGAWGPGGRGPGDLAAADLGVRISPLWPFLGPSWAVLEPSWAVLGPSWGPHGPSWDNLGGPFRLRLRPSFRLGFRLTNRLNLS